MEHYYQLLGVPQQATNDEIRKAYKYLLLHFHPDQNKSPWADTKTVLLNEAYETLMNPIARRAYDLTYANEISLSYIQKNENHKKKSWKISSKFTKSTHSLGKVMLTILVFVLNPLKLIPSLFKFIRKGYSSILAMILVVFLSPFMISLIMIILLGIIWGIAWLATSAIELLFAFDHGYLFNLLHESVFGRVFNWARIIFWNLPGHWSSLIEEPFSRRIISTIALGLGFLSALRNISQETK
jgi:curved DNA-binding protein CbpA